MVPRNTVCIATMKTRTANFIKRLYRKKLTARTSIAIPARACVADAVCTSSVIYFFLLF